MIAALEVLVDGSLIRVTLRELGSLELSHCSCAAIQRSPCLGSTLFFF